MAWNLDLGLIISPLHKSTFLIEVLSEQKWHLNRSGIELRPPASLVGR